jgi:hypothetical protein
MAQTSTTIKEQVSHKSTISDTTISFTKTGTEYKISRSNSPYFGTSDSTAFQAYDLITVTGTTNNNKTFTIKSKATDGTYIIVEEEVTTEAAGASFTLDYVGFVTDKNKGDGYYSQVDGVHTVAYHVDNTMTGSIKMQGSLATTPTEDDWFDISGTTFTADQSTLVDSKNFTGNFVWVRAKCSSMTAGSVTKILYNH